MCFYLSLRSFSVWTQRQQICDCQIPLMRGRRRFYLLFGLLTIICSPKTHLFGFPFSLAVARPARPPPVLSANIQTVHRGRVEKWIFMGLLLKILVARGAPQILHFPRKAYPTLYHHSVRQCILCNGAVPSWFRTPKQSLAHCRSIKHRVLQWPAMIPRALSWAPLQSGKLCYTLLQSDTDVCTVCYDEPHGTIFDSLAGSQKPGNDHRIKLHFYHHYYLCTPVGVIIIIWPNFSPYLDVSLDSNNWKSWSWDRMILIKMMEI